MLPQCPHLPPPGSAVGAAAISRLGADRGPAFYRLALECAQSLWLSGLPAQSLLLINRAFAADLRGDEPVFADWPLPYAAAAWIMQSRQPDQFLGVPRVHYQHLATRMVPPRKELRTWRAWGCWALARTILPDDPPDARQLEREGVVEPAHDEIAARLDRFGLPGESRLWRETLAALPQGPGASLPARHGIT